MNNDSKKKIIKLVIVSVLLIGIIIAAIVFLIVSKDKDTPKKSTYLYDVLVDEKVIKVYSDKIKINDKELEYSQENIDKFQKFISNNFTVKDKKVVIDSNDLDDHQYVILLCIIDKLSDAKFEVSLEEYEKVIYLTYEKEEYVVYLKENDIIHVKKIKRSKDGFDILEIEKAYDINFSDSNKQRLIDFINDYIGSENVTEVYLNRARKDEKPYLDSLVNNDESILKDANIKLLYSLGFKGLNCLTPSLYLYSDNTYEYYYTFAIGDDMPIPKTGTYDVDMNKILEASSKDYGDMVNVYSITDAIKHETKYIDISNSEVIKLLEQTNAELRGCLSQQDSIIH